MKWFRRDKQPVEARAITNADFFGVSLGDNGRRVTPDEALSLSAVYAAIRLVAEAVSTLPINVVQAQGGIRKTIDHPMAQLLREPNMAMTGQTFTEVLVAHLETHGEAYFEKVPGSDGRPAAIWPLEPSRITPERRGASLVFKVSTKNGVVETDQRQIGFFKNAITSPDGVRGVSPITLLNRELSAAKAARDFAANYFNNGAAPSGVLSHPAALGDKAAESLRRQFKDRYAGAKNSGSTLVLEEGMTWSTTGAAPQASQLIETRQYSISDVARIWRLPPHLLADLSRSTFSNAESEMLSLVTHSLRPRLVRLEQQLNMALLTPEERQGGLSFSFNLDGLLRGSLMDRYKSYQIGVTTGFLNRQECRALENREAVPGLETFLTTPGAATATAETEPNAESN